ncbi:beta-ketoacyl-ACP synthase III [Hominifimenecus sp. rT4P-3]|uniref:beta-ketoacyl-ACP synthase III n=1 Tax=Hominifimenecus sp. rT4P-3 TaxID=3242979 RepID=UPI003DA1EBA1
MRARILGTGSYLPEGYLTNDDLAQWLDTSDTWIRERTGIRERHITKTGTVEMAVKAAEAALANAGVTSEEIDLILVGTMTPDYFCPSVSCQVQAELGMEHAVCMDIGAACSGFLFALATAQAYLTSGMARTALVIGSETLSKVVDWSDRGTCVLFGDGAGAAVVGIDEKGVLAIDMGSKGSKGMALPCPGIPLQNPLQDASEEGSQKSYIQMDGQEIFKFAIRTVPETVRRSLQAAGVCVGDVSHFFFHQANRRILETVAKNLRIPLEKVPMNIERTGNTAAASIPLLLDEWNRKGSLVRGEKLVLSGFGAGLSWGSIVMEW